MDSNWQPTNGRMRISTENLSQCWHGPNDDDDDGNGHHSHSSSVDGDTIHHLSPSFVERQRLQLLLALPDDGDDGPPPSQCRRDYCCTVTVTTMASNPTLLMSMTTMQTSPDQYILSDINHDM